MSTTQKFTAGLAVTAAVVATLAFSPAAEALRPQVNTTAAATTLSTTQLVAMYEEERLAGDVYARFANRYGTRIFTSIGRAEDVHQSAVASLLELNGFDLSTLPTRPGVYRTDGYAELYRDLVAQGRTGLDSAYDAGVTIETRDIADLGRLLATTTDANQTRVLTALRNGSQHHLAAFSGDAQGTCTGQGPGTGQGPQGQGPRMGAGMGPGMGMGAGMGAGMGMGSGPGRST